MISPESGVSRPAKRRRSVDFPLPEGPMSTRQLELAIVRFKFCSTAFELKDLERFLSSRFMAEFSFEEAG